MSRCFACLLTLVVLLLLTTTVVVLGAEPGASPLSNPTAVLESGDLRSEGQGPGLVGNPLLIISAVVLLGFATAAVTVLIARLLQRD